MKSLMFSILTAIYAFFGIKTVNVEPLQIVSPTPTIESIEEVVEPLDGAIDTITPSQTMAVKPTQKIINPTSSINENILKTVFGLQDKQQINYILNTSSEIDSYEKKYYEMFKNYPVPKITITDPNQQIAMPGQSGYVICTGQQLQSVYSEIETIEKEIEYEKMDHECHFDRSKQETEECRVWRRDNDQNKTDQTGSGETSNTLDEQIQRYTKKIQERQTTYDRLLEKYCLEN